MGSAESKSGGGGSGAGGQRARKVQWTKDQTTPVRHSQPAASLHEYGHGEQNLVKDSPSAGRKGKHHGRKDGAKSEGKNDRVYYENLNRARKNSIERISGMRLASWLNSSRSKDNLGNSGLDRRPTSSASAPPSPRRVAKEWRDGISASAPELVPSSTPQQAIKRTKAKAKKKKKKGSEGKKGRPKVSSKDRERATTRKREKGENNDTEGTDGPEVKHESQSSGELQSNTEVEQRKKKKKKKKKSIAGHTDRDKEPDNGSSTQHTPKDRGKRKRKRRKEFQRWESTDMPQWVSKAMALEEEWERAGDRRRARAESVNKKDGDEAGIELLFDDLLQEVSSQLSISPTPAVSVTSRPTSPRDTPRDRGELRVFDRSHADIEKIEAAVQEAPTHENQHQSATMERILGREDSNAAFSVKDKLGEGQRAQGEEVHCTDMNHVPEAYVEPIRTTIVCDSSSTSQDTSARPERVTTPTAPIKLEESTVETLDAFPQMEDAKRAYAESPRASRGSVRDLVSIWELRGKSTTASPTLSPSHSPSLSFVERRNSSMNMGLSTAQNSSASRQLSPSRLSSSTSDHQRKRGASLGRRDMRNLNKILTAIDDEDTNSSSQRVSMMIEERALGGSGHLWGTESDRGRNRKSDIGSPQSWRAFARSTINLSASSGSDSGLNRGVDEPPGTTSESDSDLGDTRHAGARPQLLPSGTTVLQLTKRLMGHAATSVSQ